MATNPLELYRFAVEHTESAAGFYNRNVLAPSDAGPVIVRIPIHNADDMDLRVWPEHQVLTAIAPYVSAAPRVLHVSKSPAYQIHSYVEGKLLDDVAPKPERVPGFVPSDVVALFRQLTNVPRERLPTLPLDWPRDEDTAEFARKLSDLTASVYATFHHDFASVFSAIGIPDDPLAPVLASWSSLTRRPFRLVHADVHRKNMILSKEGTVFLDWELALWGDPLYELAVHFHKMRYQPADYDAVLQGWLRAIPPECTRGWENDLAIYLAHERVKSAIVDTIRYTQLIASGTLSGDEKSHLVTKLVDKLTVAGSTWGWKDTQHSHITPHAVEAAIHSWSGTPRRR
ncbi:MAG TPA: aminoglycoside phosphotransferase family protein [Streptosporangiaceae bacterium]|nr:aminoglycoside phosphotransferase family protein [Streptosporangiaceae bacterium]